MIVRYATESKLLPSATMMHLLQELMSDNAGIVSTQQFRVNPAYLGLVDRP